MKKEVGATLAVALILLFIITLIGVVSVRTTILQEKMSSNTQDKMASFEAAETALITAQTWLLSLTSYPVPSNNCTGFPCVQQLNTEFYPENQTITWWNANSAAYSGTPLTKVAQAPRYIIEFERFVPDTPQIGLSQEAGTYYYRVTAWGVGYTTNAQSILQASVARRF